MINVFNNTNHFPEALIFALAGLITGILQIRLLSPNRRRFYWIAASALGWSLLIISSYFGIFAILIGPCLYGAITGLVLYRVIQPENQHGTMA